MGTLLAFAIGYTLGSKGGREHFDEVTGSLREIRGTEEFAGLVMAVAGHLEHIVHEVSCRLTASASMHDPQEHAAHGWVDEWMAPMDVGQEANGRAR